MTALSSAELALLRLMAEVGVPLRISRAWMPFFPGQQARAVPLNAHQIISVLASARLVEKLTRAGTPPACLDYVLTDKGREAAELK